MSDCSPLRLAENGNSSPSQSLGSQNSQTSDNNIARTQRTNRQHVDRDNNNRARAQSESSSRDGSLKYGAKNVIELFVPVSLCMLIVVGTMKATNSYRYSGQSVIWYAQMMFTDQSVDTGTRVWQSFANAFIMLIFIVIMTIVLILLYKFRCYATIHGWLILSSLMLLFMVAVMYVAEILKVYNVPVDNYTMAIFIWNFGVVGMICIHWKGPLLLQQGYLITISALMALVFIRCLPDWTIWTVLGIVSVWDLIAVLCPCGPLRILVETAQERNEPIFPALIYSSTMMWEIGSSVLSTAVVSTFPSISMSDRANLQGKKSNRAKRSRRQNSENNEPRQSSSSSGNRRAQRGPSTEIGTPLRGDQHPVEIHYEDGAQPPEVAIIQPTISSSDIGDEWHGQVVMTVTSNSASRQRQPFQHSGDAVHSRDAPVGNLSINLQSEDSRQIVQQVEEERGVKLGLGDFIFFSVLVGKASSYEDWTITMSCFVAILVGLCLTLSLLAIFKKALPALPISIAFGLSSFFLSYQFVVPFAEKLAINQIFI